MPRLLDVNVWLPLVWEGHVANPTAHRWLAKEQEDLVLCRVTQLALLRCLTNSAIMGEDVLSNRAASELVRVLSSRREIRFCPDPAGLELLFPINGESGAPEPKRWTDSYLATFAIAGDHELVTFDGGFTRYTALGLRLCLLKLDAAT